MDYEPYLCNLTARNWSPESIKSYRSDLQLFSAFLKQRAERVTQVKPATIAAFIEHMQTMPNPRFGKNGLQPSSINRRLAAIGGWFEFLCESNPRLKNPTSFLKRRRKRMPKANPQGKAADELSLEVLLSGIDNPRDRAILLLFLSSGLRLAELCQLDVNTIQEGQEELAGNKTRIWGTGRVVGKGSKERAFYFDEQAVIALREYLSSRSDDHPALFISERKTRLSPRAIQDVFASWCYKLDLKHIHPHQFRHTFATRLANANIEALVLKDLMGHSRFETTTRYFTLSEETVARQYFAAQEFRTPTP